MADEAHSLTAGDGARAGYYQGSRGGLERSTVRPSLFLNFPAGRVDDGRQNVGRQGLWRNILIRDNAFFVILRKIRTSSGRRVSAYVDDQPVFWKSGQRRTAFFCQFGSWCSSFLTKVSSWDQILEEFWGNL